MAAGSRQSDWRGWLPTLGALALCLPALWPLFWPGFIEGHDGVEHAFRVLALATAWRDASVIGNLLPRWVPDLALGFGYPFFGVYSPLAYVFPAALTLVGVGPILAVKAAVGLALLLGGLGAYLAARTLAGTTAGVVAATAYVYAPYTLANAYVRLDLAELSAMAAAALAAAALVCLPERVPTPAAARRRVVVAAAAMASVPLCHNLSAVTFLPLFACLWLALAARVVWSRPRVVGADTAAPHSIVRNFLGSCSPSSASEMASAVARLALAPFLALGMAAFFLLPAWRWQASTRLATIPADPAFYAKLLHPIALLARHFAIPGWGWYGAGSGWWNFSVAPGAFGEFGAGPSSLAWLALPLALAALARRPGPLRAPTLALASASALSALLITSLALPFWRAFPHLTLLQFPWRFAGPLCLATALLLACLASVAPAPWRIPMGAILAVAAIVPALAYWRPIAVSVPADAIRWPAQWRRELIGGYGTTGSGLFLPRWVGGQTPAVPVWPAPRHGASDVRLVALGGRSDAFTADYVAGGAFTLTFGEWYFPGWRVTVDGRAVTATPDSAGLLTAPLPAGRHRLVVERGLTTSEIIGGLATLVTLAGIPVFLAGRRLRAILAASAVALVGVAMFGLIPPFSFSQLTGAGRAPPWSLPRATGGQTIQPAAWRLVRSPDWGSMPVLEVAWLANRPPGTAVPTTVQVRTPTGALLAEATQGPRFGTTSAANWPAGALVFDHMAIPLPPRQPDGACPSAETLALGVGGIAQPSVLGTVTLPCAPNAVPTVPEVTQVLIHGLAAGARPVVRAGDTYTLTFALRAAGPTGADDVFAFQLLNQKDQPLAQAQSYGNVDLRFSTLWQAGQTIPYDMRLTLPPTLPVGVYTLALQRFSPATGQLTPLGLPGGPPVQRLVLADVKVAPPIIVPPPTPAERFGPAIGLLSPAGGAKPTVRAVAGTSVTVQLRWLALGVPAADDTLFVHLIDGQGKLVAQADGPPLGGRYPTSAWAPGEVLDDPRTVALPAGLPVGQYTIQVGWYQPTTGARLPTTPPAPDDSFVAASVIVRP